MNSKVIVGLAVGALIAVGCTGNSTPSTGGTDSESITVPISEAPKPWNTFTDGTWQVGADIKPGRYVTIVPASSHGCYWERLRSFTNSGDNVIANGGGEANQQVIVEITKDDQGFLSKRCGTWRPKK